MPDESLTRRQAQLIQQLRELDTQLAHLRSRRNAITGELERIYPQVRASGLTPPPKEQGVILSVSNYEAHGSTCRAITSAQGTRVLNQLGDPSLQDADVVILALCTRENGADVSKLLKVKQLKELHNNPRSRVHRMFRRGYLDLVFETPVPEGIVANITEEVGA